MELSQKLKELRKKQGLTQLELAERLFVSRQAISGWEAGTSRPSTENLQSLSRLFNIPLETLLDDTAEAEPAAAPEKLPAEEQAKEEGKGQGLGKDRRYKAIVMVIVLLAILLTTAVLAHRRTAQEKTGVMTFSEMECEDIDLAGAKSVPIATVMCMALAVTANAVEYDSSVLSVEQTSLINGNFPKNVRGETYGTALMAEVVGKMPDLQAAIGTNDQEGYVRTSDLSHPKFETPQDALEWQKTQPDSYYIPLYDFQGNEIGSFLRERNNLTIAEMEAMKG